MPLFVVVALSDWESLKASSIVTRPLITYLRAKDEDGCSEKNIEPNLIKNQIFCEKEERTTKFSAFVNIVN